MKKQTVIDKLLDGNTELTADVLNQWLTHFELTSAKAAEILLVNKRSLEGWRSGRYKIPQVVLLAMRFAENNTLK